MLQERVAIAFSPLRMLCAALVVLLAAHVDLCAPAFVRPRADAPAAKTADSAYPELAACLRDELCTAAIAVPICTRSEICAATLTWLMEETPTIVQQPIRHRTLGLTPRYFTRDLVAPHKLLRE